MFCGSFHNQDDDDIIDSYSPCSSPKRSKRNSSSYKSKNRYAGRGLDKFNSLLSEVDHQKQRIFTQKGAQDISLVRFVTSNDNQIKPLVVRVKDKRQSPESKNEQFSKNENVLEGDQKQNKKQSCLESIDFEKLKHPWVIMILILMFFVFYGRSFAIICTSIGWYLMPTFLGGSSMNPKHGHQTSW